MSIVLFQVDPTSSPQVVSAVLEQYGLTGLGFLVIIGIFWKINKKSEARIEKLEDLVDKAQTQKVNETKEIIKEYTELVGSTNSVLNNLTNCLMAIKDSLKELKNK